jgi:hypothetical protein
MASPTPRHSVAAPNWAAAITIEETLARMLPCARPTRLDCLATSEKAPDALPPDAARAGALFGCQRAPRARMPDRVTRGGCALGRATRFEACDGRS